MEREKRSKIIIAGVILTCLVVPMAYLIYDYQGLIGGETPPQPEVMAFIRNNDNSTLTVYRIIEEPYFNNLTWENVKLEGIATLPSGKIDVGDVITNCNGIVSLTLRHNSRDFWLGVYYFKDVSGDYDRLVGVWKATQIINDETEIDAGTYHFFSNKTLIIDKVGMPSIYGAYYIDYTNYYFGISTALHLRYDSGPEYVEYPYYQYVFDDNMDTLTLTEKTILPGENKPIGVVIVLTKQ
ncbi:MAG: hypothetical protein NTV74_02470 [Euryarchaeota archaeon]|nr:hypothetical protein [Euryarchaeota archaeon]